MKKRVLSGLLASVAAATVVNASGPDQDCLITYEGGDPVSVEYKDPQSGKETVTKAFTYVGSVDPNDPMPKEKFTALAGECEVKGKKVRVSDPMLSLNGVSFQ